MEKLKKMNEIESCEFWGIKDQREQNLEHKEGNICCQDCYKLGIEEGKKQPKSGRKVVYDLAYNQACEDILKLMLMKENDCFNYSELNKEIRKLQEGQK